MEYGDGLSKAVGLRSVIAKTFLEMEKASEMLNFDASKGEEKITLNLTPKH
ncbi:hypothetical protein J6TS7_55530 [Paenibacillus dendritiformis]|nr:hypothetical protein J6TS7_55530 [Paenibacillus dendritiformis]